MKTEHTSTPWICGPDTDAAAFPGAVAICHQGTRTHVASRLNSHNADFIIRACNTHDELLAACETMLLAIHRGERLTAPMVQMRRAVGKAIGRGWAPDYAIGKVQP